jgi:hypothetical protein
VFRTTDEAAQTEYDYIIVTMKALPDIYDIAEIIKPGTTLIFDSLGTVHFIN